MSFGKRGSQDTPPVRAVPVAPVAPVKGAPGKNKKNNDDEEESLASIIMFVAPVTAIIGALFFGGFYLLPKPLWQGKENRFNYSFNGSVQRQLMSGKSLTNTQDGLREKMRFSPRGYFLTDDKSETVKRCAAGKKIPEITYASQAFHIYTDVTLYVSCLMEIDKERFCQSGERQKLLRILKGYSRYRQQIKGAEGYIKSLTPSRMAKKALQRAVDAELTMKGEKPVNLDMSVGEKVDARIISRLQKLVEEGYISGSDYSFMGWWLPADYAPAFINAKPGASIACG